jgi:hypothetical protein
MQGSVYKNKSGVLRTVGSSVQSKGTMLLVVTVASFAQMLAMMKEFLASALEEEVEEEG